MPIQTGNEFALPDGAKYGISISAAMCAACVTHPMDLVKTRMQIGCNIGIQGSFSCLQSVILNEGVVGLYRGVSAALLRQSSYVTARISSYTTLAEMYRQRKKEEPPFHTRLNMAIIAGSIGGMFGTPADVVLIRMEADGHSPKDQRRNYKNVADGIARIWREEGFLRLFSGLEPTMTKAALSNAVVLITYPYFKQNIRQRWNLDNGLVLQFSASMLSAFLVSIVSMPHDMAKTRLQNMRYPNGVPEYTGTMDVWKRVIQEKGTFGLYRGFNTYYSRMGPYTTLVLVFWEQLSCLYFQKVMGIRGEARWI